MPDHGFVYELSDPLCNSDFVPVRSHSDCDRINLRTILRGQRRNVKLTAVPLAWHERVERKRSGFHFNTKYRLVASDGAGSSDAEPQYSGVFFLELRSAKRAIISATPASHRARAGEPNANISCGGEGDPAL